MCFQVLSGYIAGNMMMLPAERTQHHISVGNARLILTIGHLSEALNLTASDQKSCFIFTVYLLR